MDKAEAEAKEIERRDPVQGGLALCRLFAAQQKYDEAHASAERVRGLAPENRELLFQIGRLAALSGRGLEEGVAALQRFVRDPGADAEVAVATAYVRLGNIHEKRNSPAEARAAYAEALRINPHLRAALAGLRRGAP